MKTNKTKNLIVVAGKPVNAAKYDLALRLAQRVLSLPDGSWPETAQAERDLDDALPKNFGMEEMLEIARTTPGTYFHPDR